MTIVPRLTVPTIQQISSVSNLASVHKYLRLCDLCKELAFGAPAQTGKVAISYNSFAFSVLCRQFLESVHKYLRLCDLCKELAFGAQRAGVKSHFIQLVRVQRVMPPVPGEREFQSISSVTISNVR